MNRIYKLTEYFSRFPGIGPRQAKRFVFFLLSQPSSFHNDLADLLKGLKDEVNRCIDCHRFFAINGVRTNICNICGDKTEKLTH